jgi:hypothetical protein
MSRRGLYDGGKADHGLIPRRHSPPASSARLQPPVRSLSDETADLIRATTTTYRRKTLDQSAALPDRRISALDLAPA